MRRPALPRFPRGSAPPHHTRPWARPSHVQLMAAGVVMLITAVLVLGVRESAVFISGDDGSCLHPRSRIAANQSLSSTWPTCAPLAAAAKACPGLRKGPLAALHQG